MNKEDHHVRKCKVGKSVEKSRLPHKRGTVGISLHATEKFERPWSTLRSHWLTDLLYHHPQKEIRLEVAVQCCFLIAPKTTRKMPFDRWQRRRNEDADRDRDRDRSSANETTDRPANPQDQHHNSNELGTRRVEIETTIETAPTSPTKPVDSMRGQIAVQQEETTTQHLAESKDLVKPPCQP